MKSMLFCLLTACGGTTAEDPSAPCARVGQQCRLPTGPLGVCLRGTGDDFVCTPQH